MKVLLATAHNETVFIREQKKEKTKVPAGKEGHQVNASTQTLFGTYILDQFCEEHHVHIQEQPVDQISLIN